MCCKKQRYPVKPRLASFRRDGRAGLQNYCGEEPRAIHTLAIEIRCHKSDKSTKKTTRPVGGGSSRKVKQELSSPSAFRRVKPPGAQTARFKIRLTDTRDSHLK